jgi:hypothetical protein
MRHLMKITFLALLSLVVMPLAAAAHPNHARKVLGTVSAITAERLTLKDAKGKETAIVLTKDTKVVRAKQPADMKDVAVGARVVVTAAPQKEQLVAQQVDITRVKAAATDH